MKKIAIVVLLSAFVAAPAVAADNTGKFYVAGDYGSVSFTDTLPPGSTVKLPNPGSLRIAGGYHVMPMLAVEAGYLMIGDSTLAETGFGITTSNSALQVAAVGIFPVASSVDLIGKLGISMNSNKFVATGFPFIVDSSTTSTTMMFGIGAQFKVNQQVSIRAQYENFGKFKTNDGPVPPVTSWNMGVSQVSAGVVYNF